MRLIADIGAYEMVLTAAIPTLVAFMISGVYDIGVVRCDLTEVFTNKMPTDAYRGAGRPEGIYFLERGIDMLAARLEMDPAELRRRNFIQPEQFPLHHRRRDGLRLGPSTSARSTRRWPMPGGSR